MQGHGYYGHIFTRKLPPFKSFHLDDYRSYLCTNYFFLSLLQLHDTKEKQDTFPDYQLRSCQFLHFCLLRCYSF